MVKPLVTTKPVSTVAAIAARLSIASGLLFVLLLGSRHLLEPELDPTWRFISEYALGNFGWMMRLAFLSLATSLASAGVAIVSQIRTVVGYIGLAILGIAAIGFLIAAIFKTDPATTSREAATFSGKMHIFGPGLARIVKRGETVPWAGPAHRSVFRTALRHDPRGHWHEGKQW